MHVARLGYIRLLFSLINQINYTNDNAKCELWMQELQCVQNWELMVMNFARIRDLKEIMLYHFEKINLLGYLICSIIFNWISVLSLIPNKWRWIDEWKHYQTHFIDRLPLTFDHSPDSHSRSGIDKHFYHFDIRFRSPGLPGIVKDEG